MLFSVKGSMKEITRDLSRVQRKIVPAATVSALNKTAVTVRAAATRDISESKRITPQRLIREKLPILRASKRAPSAVILSRLTSFLASELGAIKQLAKGSRVKKHFFPGAFVATMPTGHTGIFKRIGKPRLPIVEQRISVQPIANKILGRHVRTTGATAWVKNFQRELKWRLNKKRL